MHGYERKGKDMTNLKAVRSMGAEKLARLLASSCLCELCAEDDYSCESPDNEKACVEGITAWLRQKSRPEDWKFLEGFGRGQDA